MTALLAAVWMTWGIFYGPGPDPRVHLVREFRDSRILIEEKLHDRPSCVSARHSASTGETVLVRLPKSRCSPERFWARISTLGETFQSEWIEITDHEHAVYAVGDELGRPSRWFDEPEDKGSSSGSDGPDFWREP